MMKATSRPRDVLSRFSIRAFISAVRLRLAKIYMSDKVFVDTNVLIYAHDVDAREKHLHARNILRDLWSEETGVISPQVLQEFYVNVTRKISTPMSKKSARWVIENYAGWCIDMSPADIFTAFKIEDGSRIGFWDALIVASAIKAGAALILSEDLNAGQTIAGIRIENPFSKKS
jgi:predicted nucleic acid-binding protein